MKRIATWGAEFGYAGRRPVLECRHYSKPERGTYIVTHGFGGPTAGKEASRRIVEAMSQFLEKEAGDLEATLPFVLRSYLSLGGNVIFNAMIHANRDISSWNQERKVHLRGGASAIAAYVDGDFFSVGLIGTCQGYLFRRSHSGYSVRSLILPHSYERSLAPMETSEVSIPLRTIGIGRDIEPELIDVRIESGDVFLLANRAISLEQQQELAKSLDRDAAHPSIEALLQPVNRDESLAGLWIGF